MHKLLLTLCCACAGLCVHAQQRFIGTFRVADPIALRAPLMIDSLNINGARWDESSLLDADVDITRALTGQTVDGDSVVLGGEGYNVHLVSFAMKNQRRCPVTIDVKGVRRHQLYVDGEIRSGATMTLHPSTHQVVVKVLTTGQADTLRVSVDGDVETMAASADAKRALTLLDLMTGERCNGVSLSPDGRWMIVHSYCTGKDGKTSYKTLVREVATGRIVNTATERIAWLPKTSKYYVQRRDREGRNQLIAIDPATLAETVMVRCLPEGYFTISPDEEYLVYHKADEGPAKDRDVYEIREPEDRMSGFRSRNQLSIYNIKSGVKQPLTFGHHAVSLLDISSDGSQMLLQLTERRMTERPTTLSSYLLLDVRTMRVDTLVSRDGFVSGGRFSPDGRSLLITGSPECLGGVGMNVREGQTPNIYDIQMYVMDIATRTVRPLTCDFRPSVQSTAWSRFDDHIYFIAEDKDCKHLFRMHPVTCRVDMIDISEDYVGAFSIASERPVLAAFGQSLSNTSRLYTVDVQAQTFRNPKARKVRLVHDYSADILADVALGEFHPWGYATSRGDTLSNGYILPADFDATRKYPLIVYYYGGCSPTSRYMDSHYPFHLFAAQGYVVLYVNPSGATGFGQEFSARHVNTAGEGVADDIIESAKAFCALHDFIDSARVGCIGASYGGFMTQYLQTQTDFFACAISHAGISDHTSYWGEGYWGYSYSEVSMAHSYPWRDRDLYVGHSPLYNADKIHTPILFLHGTADTNVPVGESIQMFTALKLLGRETAFVAVEGQDHHIVDFNKRIKWQNTIFAWFAKYLQGDDAWWNELYKPF